MASLSDIRTRIQAKLDDGSLQRPNASEIDAQINSTIEYYENNAFWFTQAQAVLTTTVDDEVLGPVPSDFKMLVEPNPLVIEDGGVLYPLAHITSLDYDTLDVSARGRPCWFTYRNGQIELYFIPSQVYTVYLNYRKRYADLVNDSDENDFTNYADRLIEYRTLADLLYDYREDFERGAIYQGRADEELRQIKMETYNRTATGNLSTENIVDATGAHFFGNYYY